MKMWTHLLCLLLLCLQWLLQCLRQEQVLGGRWCLEPQVRRVRGW